MQCGDDGDPKRSAVPKQFGDGAVSDVQDCEAVVIYRQRLKEFHIVKKPVAKESKQDKPVISDGTKEV